MPVLNIGTDTEVGYAALHVKCVPIRRHRYKLYIHVQYITVRSDVVFVLQVKLPEKHAEE